MNAPDKRGWLPIDSVPADARRILGWCEYAIGAEVRLCEKRTNTYGWWAHGVTQNVTHWQPLPEPPEAAE